MSSHELFTANNTDSEEIMEVYTLTISFPYEEDDEPWSRTIEVKEDFTL